MNTCKVECIGKSKKNKWTHLFPSTYGGYAMLLEKHLMDLPGKRFLIHQINEHSKGAHYEYEIQLMDLQGNVLYQFSGRFNSNFILNNKYVYFLMARNKTFRFRIDCELDLIKLDYYTGKVKQIINLNYPELLNCSDVSGVWVELVEKNNNDFIQIKYTEIQKNKRTKLLPLTDF